MSKKPEWRLVNNFGVERYLCGAKAGQTVRLKVDLAIRDHLGHLTGMIFKKGEQWKVVKGSKESPKIIFLHDSENNLHTWDDDSSFWEQFEPVTLIQ